MSFSFVSHSRLTHIVVEMNLAIIDKFERLILKFDRPKTLPNGNVMNIGIQRSKIFRMKSNWNVIESNEKMTEIGGNKTTVIGEVKII